MVLILYPAIFHFKISKNFITRLYICTIYLVILFYRNTTDRTYSCMFDAHTNKNILPSRRPFA